MLASEPPGSDVTVDGQALGTTPLTARLAAGTHTVAFRFHDVTRSMQLTVPGGGRVEGRLDWSRKPTGGLHVTSTPTGAHVLVDGEDRGTTPLSIGDLVTGSHTIVVRSTEGAVQRSVTIEQGKIAEVDESIFAGWVKVFSPFEVTVAENGHVLTLDDRSELMLSAGRHELEFTNRRLGYDEIQPVDVQPGGQATLSLVPQPSKITVNASVPSEVWIDGSLAGQTPLVDHPITLGTREVIVKSGTGDQRRFMLTVTVQPLSLTVDFSKPASPGGP